MPGKQGHGFCLQGTLLLMGLEMNFARVGTSAMGDINGDFSSGTRANDKIEPFVTAAKHMTVMMLSY